MPIETTVKATRDDDWIVKHAVGVSTGAQVRQRITRLRPTLVPSFPYRLWKIFDRVNLLDSCGCRFLHRTRWILFASNCGHLCNHRKFERAKMYRMYIHMQKYREYLKCPLQFILECETNLYLDLVSLRTYVHKNLQSYEANNTRTK